MLTEFLLSTRVAESMQKQIYINTKFIIYAQNGLNSLFSTKGGLCRGSDDFKFSTSYTGHCTLYTGCRTY
jgi:hypothetical protein